MYEPKTNETKMKIHLQADFRKNKKAVFTKFRRNNKPVQKHTSRNVTRRDTAKKNDKKHFKPKTKKTK